MAEWAIVYNGWNSEDVDHLLLAEDDGLTVVHDGLDVDKVVSRFDSETSQTKFKEGRLLSHWASGAYTNMGVFPYEANDTGYRKALEDFMKDHPKAKRRFIGVP